MVAGARYPADLRWPANVEHVEHLAPADHPAFHAAQRFTLSVTRADMRAAGWSPSVRLFEAGACAVPVISDRWDGIDAFFVPGEEIEIADATADIQRLLGTPDRRLGVRSGAAPVTASSPSTPPTIGCSRSSGTWPSSWSHHEDAAIQRKPAAAVRARPLVSQPASARQPADRSRSPSGRLSRFKWEQIEPHLPASLTGCRALDIGCYTFELAKRGAQVLAIDIDAHYLRQARWAAERLGLRRRIELRQLGVYDLARIELERFDVVLFLAVLYHLRHPLLALDLVAGLTDQLAVIQTLTLPGEDSLQVPPDLSLDERARLRAPGWPTMAFIEHALAGDPTNWWAPNVAAVEAMLRSAGLTVTARPGHEIWVCRPDPGSGMATRVAEELRAATGRTG